jgi:hypothetical protein
MSKALSLPCVGTFSSKPIYRCKTCGAGLYTERSDRSQGNEWLFTRDGKRHFKTRCNLTERSASAQEGTL